MNKDENLNSKMHTPQEHISDEEVQRIIAETKKVIKAASELNDELNYMFKDIKFLQDEYLKNKKYFCSEGSRPTINDVIKTVYEFAWASRGNYDYNKNNKDVQSCDL